MTTLANTEYDFIRQVVQEHSRIHLGPNKQALVVSRVQKRLRALGLPDFVAYCDYLRSRDGQVELTELTDAISTNVTNFFREPQHFDFLREAVLPDWLATGPDSCRRPFRVWSAASSSGEEPYSIAMVLAEFFQENPKAAWQVEATDISTRMLAKANEAIYPAERINVPKPEWLRQFFQRGTGRWKGHYRVKESLRNQVRFHHLNLFQPEWPFTPGFDVIFCRNVMIYFESEAQAQLVGRFSKLLAVGGYLIVGHSESLIGFRHPLTGIKPSIYRREH